MKQETRMFGKIWPERDRTPATTINPPLYRGSTVLFDGYQQMIQVNRHEYEGITYGTDRLPTQRQFEEAMRELEGGAVTRVFQSGIAAIQTALLAFTRSGDHILVCDNAYGPGQRFCRKVLKKFDIDYTPVPADVGADIAQYIRPNTVLILLESPGSITFEIQDIPAITAIARQKNIITVLDATWATPLYVKPFELGIDVSIHSVTKYISGYSDVLAGTVTVNERNAETFAAFYKLMEIYTPAEECYLALRGLHSMATRLRQHQQSALTIARWLESVAIVDQVLHPALPSHPEHHLWQRDFTGSSGLFAFTFKKEYTDEQLTAFIDSLRLFRLGYSWGGYQSLLTAARIVRATPSRYAGKTVVRLSIGLEDCEDLRHDLEQGLALL
ncbi:cystathionine beta-lyase [Desulfopila sp. IMCC35006]|uniref:cystathionine beta-lyase n=1 Tax=Desulfopila sp. IMCC35006 TaxID=2569542 RepID=UPI00197A974A|nr:cystathionine beta-lyase [Desulfopila sp. IMCC35006]